jgi:predicted transcriptional regulator
MSDELTRTTVYVDAEAYRRLKARAEREGRTAAELVREAVSQYMARQLAAPRATSIGKGRSGKGNVSERAETLLKGMGRRR